MYEDVYCARGDMENRIQEQQLGLFADRTSCGSLRTNELRLWFSSAAYVRMTALQRRGLQGYWFTLMAAVQKRPLPHGRGSEGTRPLPVPLQGTELQSSQCDTIRRKLLKIGARIKATVRHVWLSPAKSDPYRPIVQRVYDNLVRRCPIPLRC